MINWDELLRLSNEELKNKLLDPSEGLRIVAVISEADDRIFRALYERLKFEILGKLGHNIDLAEESIETSGDTSSWDIDEQQIQSLEEEVQALNNILDIFEEQFEDRFKNEARLQAESRRY